MFNLHLVIIGYYTLSRSYLICFEFIIFMNLLKKAEDFAKEIHKNQKRDDGSPYIKHPLEVKKILEKEFQVNDWEVLAASLLHDLNHK